MKFNVLTIFPSMIDSYSDESILARGQKAGAIKITTVNPRDFAEDKHSKVDDTPYGGGPGMVMKPEPIYKALKSIDAIPFAKVDGLTKVKKIFNGSLSNKKRTILLSPRGRQFDQSIAQKWSHLDEITFVCGRYEGIDQRVVDHMVDEEVSVGPYVLAGGELGALIMIEAVSRLVPGVLGNAESLEEETFNTKALEHDSTEARKHNSTKAPKHDSTEARVNKKSAQVLKCSSAKVTKEYPQYTKPSDFKGWKVPDILLSGDHAEIKKWREEQQG